MNQPNADTRSNRKRQRPLWSAPGSFLPMQEKTPLRAANRWRRRPRLVNAAGLCILVSLLFSGCASPKAKFQSVKDPAYHAKLERVLLLPADEDTGAYLGRGFMDKLLLRLETVLNLKGVATQVVRVEKWELDQNASLNTAAAQFRATHFLVLALAHFHTTQRLPRWYPMQVIEPGPDTSVVFAFRIVAGSTGKTVWRSEASFYVIPRPESVADQLVEQLAAAEFL